ncbi:DNA-directed RNA polymerase III subunit RPC5-like isoform X2 [Nematostella vectensis]|uniref:DNA-directed RNA polymerase III subunit RPC5-like isoform X2 n=1 Tax=Nematostella vectensis TaxID=45351 RepID=UPI002077518D|nr:DNA-directed RNA polymerase III subunit RPC5-like isoform X2 [Nematostella vectensis]
MLSGLPVVSRAGHAVVSSKMADEEDEDAVVQEVDVFLAKSLADKLYLFQYPSRPAVVTYDPVQHLGARIKPQQQKVEIELAVNTSGSNYYEPRGEQIASDVDRRANDAGEKDIYFASGLMDKQVLSSGQTPADASRYAVAVLKEGELHLTPLRGVLQLRPNLQYIDKVEAGVKQTAIGKDDGDSQDEEEDAKTVTVRMARPETDKAKLQRMSSFKYLEKKEAEEQWIPLQYYPPQHSMASLDRDDLLCKDASAESPEISVSPREYLKLLTPSSVKRENSQPKMPCNVLSMTQLKTMELSEQVKALLVNAKLMSFSQLCTLLAPMAKEAVILKHLQQFAVLVQGSWVVKSEVLYPEGTVSPNSGIPAVILCRGRDYILWRFTQSRVVVRKDIASVTKLPNEDIKAMLEHISRMRVAQGWEFLLPCDTEFIHKHPEVFKHFVSFWESKHEMLASSLNISKTHTHEKASADHKDHKKVHTDGSESQETTKRAPRVSKLEANHAIPKSQKTLPNMNNNATESSTPMEVEEFVDTGDIHVTKQPLSADSEHFQEVFKRLQDFVSEKLHRTVLSFAEFKRLLLLKQTACPPGDAFCLGVSDSLLEDAILTSGATEVDVMWPTAPLHKDLHSRKLYAFRTIGDEAIDKVRDTQVYPS